MSRGEMAARAEAVFAHLLAIDYRGLANFELEEPDDVEALRRSRECAMAAIRAAVG